jgi:hypothetical protein
MHTKRPRIVATPTTVEQEVPPTTVTTIGFKCIITPPFGSSQYKAITTTIPKKYTDSPLDTQPNKTEPKLGIFEKYELIKKKNQTLTSSTYA